MLKYNMRYEILHDNKDHIQLAKAKLMLKYNRRYEILHDETDHIQLSKAGFKSFEQLMSHDKVADKIVPKCGFESINVEFFCVVTNYLKCYMER